MKAFSKLWLPKQSLDSLCSFNPLKTLINQRIHTYKLVNSFISMDLIKKIFSDHPKNSQHHSKNKQSMHSFVDIVQKKANKQNEDRICYDYIPSINAYTFTILDGHGSKQCAEFAHKTINSFIKKRFEQNQKLKTTLNQIVQKSLNQAFEDLENEWFKVYKKHEYENEFKKSGACCLTTVVFLNTIHVANAGDCEGVILGKHEPIKTNKRLNAGEPEEKKRLKKLFPTESDIVVDQQKATKTCSYVKGVLQPTKAIGDFELKYKEENLSVKNFNGPYIDYKPSFTHFKTKAESEFLVLGTDGLWDELIIQDLDRVAQKSKGKLADALYEECMKHIKKRNHMTEEELDKVEQKRLYHDDISIICVDLKRLKEELKEKKQF